MVQNDPIELTELEVDIPLVDLAKCSIDNTSHKFGEVQKYFQVQVTWKEGMVANCLLTENQIIVGIKRALRNQEDCPLTESFGNFINKPSKGEEDA